MRIPRSRQMTCCLRQIVQSHNINMRIKVIKINFMWLFICVSIRSWRDVLQGWHATNRGTRAQLSTTTSWEALNVGWVPQCSCYSTSSTPSPERNSSYTAYKTCTNYNINAFLCIFFFNIMVTSLRRIWWKESSIFTKKIKLLVRYWADTIDGFCRGR